jgi:uncharacterized cupin superfamily protein
VKAEWHFAQQALLEHVAKLPEAARFHYPLRHGTMKIGVYAPVGVDDQSPHDQDELYIVITGSGFFTKAAESVPFGPGDVFFVEAGAEHRFQQFTPDFCCWVIFWGPPGGECGVAAFPSCASAAKAPA